MRRKRARVVENYNPIIVRTRANPIAPEKKRYRWLRTGQGIPVTEPNLSSRWSKRNEPRPVRWLPRQSRWQVSTYHHARRVKNPSRLWPARAHYSELN